MACAEALLDAFSLCACDVYPDSKVVESLQIRKGRPKEVCFTRRKKARAA